ncbi:hypothetical protein [Desulfopila aestuarii]|uniref:Uncharacterized protein n=1 Tax=Desulfopila aestuarii DSM 18488 TaxID=1121416 RepID=A0A1M7YK80_9BACT|nr:hypothetical protein [Desulfopila aestuarii]SHO52976.1 hypothetical protein SAMN02745220_04865 [Desulfopila aestuarii DSM 18488]
MTLNHARVTGQRFQLGRTVITRGALAFCEDNNIDYLDLIIRHAVGDFGTVGRLTDAALTTIELEKGALVTSNDLKLSAVAVQREEGILMSVYPCPGFQDSTIWIQTMLAGDDTYTTVLLPSEY